MAEHDPWEAAARFDHRFACQMLRANGECQPMFVIYRGAGHRIPYGVQFRDPEQKRLVRRAMTLICAAENASAVSFISEAWMRDMKIRDGESTEDAKIRAQEYAPSEAPDRIEVLITLFAYYDAGGRRQTLGATSPIIRPNGKPSADPNVKMMTEANEGLMAGILPDPRPNMRQREKARAALGHIAPGMLESIGVRRMRT